MPQSARDTAAAITASGLVLIMATAMAVLWVQGRPVPPDLYMTLGAGLGFLGLAVAPRTGLRAPGSPDPPPRPAPAPGGKPRHEPAAGSPPGPPAEPASAPPPRRSRTRPRAGEGPR
jgi:hypothetical protein